jgi:alpha-glucosidase
VTIARRRGREWFVGSLTSWTAREIEIPLGFLGDGDFAAEVHADDPDSGAHPTKTTFEEMQVTARTALTLKLASGGGAAVRLRPTD